MTSSARARIDRGDGQAERLRGLEIDDQLEPGRLFDRQIGGFGARQNPTDIDPDPAKHDGEAGSIADQPAGRGEFAPLIDRRNGMTLCQRYELLAPAQEKSIGTDNERSSLQLDKGGESAVDPAFAARLEDMELHPLRARGRLDVAHDALGARIAWVHEQGDHVGVRN
jgi:hypothetical protein